jgi:hypothetical protein
MQCGDVDDFMQGTPNYPALVNVYNGTNIFVLSPLYYSAIDGIYVVAGDNNSRSLPDKTDNNPMTIWLQCIDLDELGHPCFQLFNFTTTDDYCAGCFNLINWEHGEAEATAAIPYKSTFQECLTLNRGDKPCTAPVCSASFPLDITPSLTTTDSTPPTTTMMMTTPLVVTSAIPTKPTTNHSSLIIGIVVAVVALLAIVIGVTAALTLRRRQQSQPRRDERAELHHADIVYASARESRVSDYAMGDIAAATRDEYVVGTMDPPSAEYGLLPVHNDVTDNLHRQPSSNEQVCLLAAAHCDLTRKTIAAVCIGSDFFRCHRTLIGEMSCKSTACENSLSHCEVITN